MAIDWLIEGYLLFVFFVCDSTLRVFFILLLICFIMMYSYCIFSAF